MGIFLKVSIIWIFLIDMTMSKFILECSHSSIKVQNIPRALKRFDLRRLKISRKQLKRFIITTLLEMPNFIILIENKNPAFLLFKRFQAIVTSNRLKFTIEFKNFIPFDFIFINLDHIDVGFIFAWFSVKDVTKLVLRDVLLHHLRSFIQYPWLSIHGEYLNWIF